MTGLNYPAALRDYIAGVQCTGDELAARIDATAKAVLDSIATQATKDMKRLVTLQKTDEKKQEVQAKLDKLENTLALDKDVC